MNSIMWPIRLPKLLGMLIAPKCMESVKDEVAREGGLNHVFNKILVPKKLLEQLSQVLDLECGSD